MTLREQVEQAVMFANAPNAHSEDALLKGEQAVADAVLVVFAERERLLRERIEALPKYSVDSREWRRMVCLTDVLGVFDDES